KRAGAEVVGTAESLRLLMVTPILMCFAYFVLLAISMVGLQTFAIPTTMQFYETSLGTATTALTGFLLGGSLGILAGGVLADRTTQHHLVACAGIRLASAGVAAIASGHVPAALLVPLFSIVGF